MNNVVLIGRLVRDPELRFLSGSGRAVVNFTLAVEKEMSREKKAEMKAQGKPTADFIRIVAWGKTAELCANYLSKGRQVAIQGTINTGSYQDKDGKTVYTTDVIAQKVEFIGGRDKNEQTSDYTRNQSDFSEISDDDIPF